MKISRGALDLPKHQPPHSAAHDSDLIVGCYIQLTSQKPPYSPIHTPSKHRHNHKVVQAVHQLDRRGIYSFPHPPQLPRPARVSEEMLISALVRHAEQQFLELWHLRIAQRAAERLEAGGQQAALWEAGYDDDAVIASGELHGADVGEVAEEWDEMGVQLGEVGCEFSRDDGVRGRRGQQVGPAWVRDIFW